MAKRVSACIILAVLMRITAAQSPPKDVNGWGKIKWGMTLAEARTVYGTDVKESTRVPGPAAINPYIEKLIIENIKAGDMSGLAALWVSRGSENISRVTTSFVSAKSKTFQSARSDAYETLKVLLIQKYGAPANEDQKPAGDLVIKTVLWTFPSTSIHLNWGEIRGFDIGYVEVEYTAVDKKATDAL